MITILLALVIVGIAWYFLQPYIGEPFRTMIIVIVILLFCIWLLSLIGVIPPLRMR